MFGGGGGGGGGGGFFCEHAPPPPPKNEDIISMLAKQNKTKPYERMHQPKKLDCGLIEGKFVNNRVLSRLVHASVFC